MFIASSELVGSAREAHDKPSTFNLFTSAAGESLASALRPPSIHSTRDNIEAFQQEPLMKKKTAGTDFPGVHTHSPLKDGVLRSPVKRSAAFAENTPPSVTRLLSTVKRRLIHQPYRLSTEILEECRSHLHTLPQQQPRQITAKNGTQTIVTPKRRDALLHKSNVYDQLSRSIGHSKSRTEITQEMVDSWPYFINNSVYKCLDAQSAILSAQQRKNLISTLVSLVPCNNTYDYMLESMQQLVIYQTALGKCGVPNAHLTFPPPLMPTHLMLRVLITDCSAGSTALKHLVPHFVEVYLAYHEHKLLYDPYADALIGKQKAIKRNEELGSPKFYTHLPARTAPDRFEQLSVIYGATIVQDLGKDLQGTNGNASSLQSLSQSFKAYEMARLSFYSGILAECFSLCKSVAFVLTGNVLQAFSDTAEQTRKTLFKIDSELLSLITAGTIDDNKLAGMIALSYSHEIGELVICNRQTPATPTDGSPEMNCYFNLTISQHDTIISMLYTEIARYSDGILTTNRMYLILIALGLNPNLASYDWFLLQFQLTIFRLAKTQFVLMNQSDLDAAQCIRTVINPYSIFIHVMLKYKLEFDTSFTPLLKKMHRQDLVSTACTGVYLVLDTRVTVPPSTSGTTAEQLISKQPATSAALAESTVITPPIRASHQYAVQRSDTPSASLELLLTDGFYLVRATVDPLFQSFLSKYKIQLCKHEKLVVSLPQSTAFGSAQEPPIRADWCTEATLILTYYNTKRVPTGSFLGRCQRPFISTSIQNAVNFALEERLGSQRSTNSNTVPHMPAMVMHIFEPVMVVRRVANQAGDERPDAQERDGIELKTYTYRRFLVADPNNIDADKLIELSTNPNSQSSAPAGITHIPCFFVHQLGSKAGIIESLEPGMQIELISTSIKRYLPQATDEKGSPSSHSYLQFVPAMIIYSPAVNSAVPRELRTAFKRAYQSGLFAIHSGLNELEHIQDQTVYFYCLGSGENVPPLYCFRLSDDSTRLFDLIEVLQNPRMSIVYVHSAKDQVNDNPTIEVRSDLRKLTKLVIKSAIFQDKGKGKYRIVCLDESVINKTGESFFYENDDQTRMYVELLEESIRKYL